jgi:hypothetical protein
MNCKGSRGLHCCYTVVTLLLHCCHSVVTMLLHCRVCDGREEKASMKEGSAYVY